MQALEPPLSGGDTRDRVVAAVSVPSLREATALLTVQRCDLQGQKQAQIIPGVSAFCLTFTPACCSVLSGFLVRAHAANAAGCAQTTVF